MTKGSQGLNILQKNAISVEKSKEFQFSAFLKTKTIRHLTKIYDSSGHVSKNAQFQKNSLPKPHANKIQTAIFLGGFTVGSIGSDVRPKTYWVWKHC